MATVHQSNQSRAKRPSTVSGSHLSLLPLSLALHQPIHRSLSGAPGDEVKCLEVATADGPEAKGPQLAEALSYEGGGGMTSKSSRSPSPQGRKARQLPLHVVVSSHMGLERGSKNLHMDPALSEIMAGPDQAKGPRETTVVVTGSGPPIGALWEIQGAVPEGPPSRWVLGALQGLFDASCGGVILPHLWKTLKKENSSQGLWIPLETTQAMMVKIASRTLIQLHEHLKWQRKVLIPKRIKSSEEDPAGKEISY
ncbi:hypothetical protein BHM03_00031042 [Ensete ventricosum]|nr:hypothetical protein BHM03_00031042 [Ensete ventricosum]